MYSPVVQAGENVLLPMKGARARACACAQALGEGEGEEREAK